MFAKKISLVIPAYNEAKRLPRTLKEVQAWLTIHVKTFEIIVVDDGSKDETPRLAQQLSQQVDHLRVITNADNRGKGAVVRQGLALATGEIIGYLDADHSTNICEMRPALALIERGYDAAIGSRYLKKSLITKRQSVTRIIVSRLANLVTRLLFLPGIHDTQNGFKVFKASSVKKVLPYLSQSGWVFDIELLFVMRRLGQKIIEFPVTWQNDQASHLRVKKALLTGFGDIIHILRRRARGDYPRRIN